MNKAPFPANESARVKSLLELDLDYSSLEHDFKYIAQLATKFTGMDLSVVNLIDTYNQWSIAHHGLQADSVPREESVCQFTILEEDYYEVKDLSLDERHNDKFYVTGDPHLRYYLGVPIRTRDGLNIGSLCVLDREVKSIKPNQIEYLKILADEIVLKLTARKTFSELRNQFDNTVLNHKRIGIELQETLAGIIGISDVLLDLDIVNMAEDKENFISLINERSKALVELVKPLITERQDEVELTGMNLQQLAGRLDSLYSPFAARKNQSLSVNFEELKNHIHFSRKKILGALNEPISRAIYFSTGGSSISISLDIKVLTEEYVLIADIKSTSKLTTGAANISLPEPLESTIRYFDADEGWHSELSVPLHVV
jgi:GAF domain-containing protein